jgi:regulator of sigma E protease
VIKKLLVVDKSVTVIRDGKNMELDMPVDLIGNLVEKRKKSERPIISPRVPVIVLDVNEDANVYKAGLRKGDQIVSINNQPVFFRDELEKVMSAQKKGSTINLTILRNDSNYAFNTVLPEDNMIGFSSPNSHEQYNNLGIYKYTVKKYGFFAAIPAGVKRAGAELGFYIDQFKKILSPQTGAYKGVGGFKYSLLKELIHSGGIAWASGIMVYQKSLKDKIMILKSKF